MLRDAAVGLIAQRLGNRSDLTARIILEMQLVQADTLERHHWLPWFLETEFNDAVAGYGDPRISMPPEFLQEIEDETLWMRNRSETEWQPLDRVASDQATKNTTTTGRPEAYTISGEYLVLLPYALDQDYLLSWRYYGAATVLDTNIENKWLKYAPKLLIAATCYALAEHVERRELKPEFQADITAAWDTLYRLHTAREEANRTRKMEA
jgi:hypothetical protein